MPVLRLPSAPASRASGGSRVRSLYLFTGLGPLASLLMRLCFLCAILAVAWWLWGRAGMTWPTRHRLEAATLQLQPDQSVLLGRRELAAPAADMHHLRVWRDTSGAWWLTNVSPQLAVAYRSTEHAGLLRQVPLLAGQRLWVAGEAWQIEATQPALILAPEAPGQGRWLYDGTLLKSLAAGDEPPRAQLTCADTASSGHLRHGWNRTVPSWLAWPASLHWGGSQGCGNRLPHSQLPVAGLTVALQQGVYLLQAGPESARRVCLRPLTDQTCPAGASLFEHALALQGVKHITLGRTTLFLEFVGDRLQFTPARRGGWLPADATAPPVQVLQFASADSSGTAAPALAWRIERADPWKWSSSLSLPLTAALGLVIMATMAAWMHQRHRTRETTALALCTTTGMLLASIGLYLIGQTMGPAVSLAWGLVAVASMVLLPGPTGWAWCSHAALATMLLIGLGMQWQLGLQGADTGAWTFVQKSSALGAAGLYALHSLAWWLKAREQVGHPARWLNVLYWELALLLPALAALVLLALQALFGGEEGVFGFQPVELAKLALVLLGAHALAIRLEWCTPRGWLRLGLWLRLVMPVALFMALGATALLLLQDYSPLVLMGVWVLGIVLAWSAAAGSWVALFLGAATIGSALVGLHWMQAGGGVAWMQAHGFYGERFAVWQQPLLHPHSGEQVLRAIRLAIHGEWWGDSLAPAWRVPAVQDDMAPAFFVGRFGLLAALGLWALQCLYIASLLMLGWRALAAVQPGDYRRRWGLRLVFFAAWGAAALFAGHLLLSWGTNTGALPVMGQPMPLLSAGGSVMVLLLAPLHLLWQAQPALAACRA